MQTSPIRRPFVVLLCTFVLAACSRTDEAPLLRATLRSVTLVSADAVLDTQLRGWGFEPVAFAANYPGTVRVHALMWEVPESVVEKAREFTASAAAPAHARLLVTAPPAGRPGVSQGDVREFYRSVLGVDLPGFPPTGKLPEGVRVHAWTFSIPSVLEASRLLRARNIPVVFSPVGLTSPIFGDHKALAIRAPDGVLVELIETTAS
jgi:hypothetical protein